MNLKSNLKTPNHIKTQAAGKPKVEIFYETLNDVVRRFFVEQYQLISRNSELLDQIDLRLYPYGNTMVSGSNAIYTCPYGDDQCDANKLHVIN